MRSSDLQARVAALWHILVTFMWEKRTQHPASVYNTAAKGLALGHRQLPQ